MKHTESKKKLSTWDDRRNLIIPGDREETVSFCVSQFLEIAKEAIQKRGIFTVALSGGQTPHAIFKELSQPAYLGTLDWKKVLCFWSDERNVPPDNLESNYFTAMQAGLAKLPLLPEHIFRMPAETNIEENALAYEQLIKNHVLDCSFDLVMLGMGEDGHTASLFPRTLGLHASSRLVIANYIPQKNQWRMSLTYECIHKAKNISIYVMGANKAKTVHRILKGLYDPDNLPIQKVGTHTNKALWILDSSAGSEIEAL